MVEGGVFGDLGVPSDTINLYKVIIQKLNGKKFTLKWDKFKNVNVDTLIRINNIDSDYNITLKRSTP